MSKLIGVCDYYSGSQSFFPQIWSPCRHSDKFCDVWYWDSYVEEMIASEAFCHIFQSSCKSLGCSNARIGSFLARNIRSEWSDLIWADFGSDQIWPSQIWCFPYSWSTWSPIKKISHGRVHESRPIKTPCPLHQHLLLNVPSPCQLRYTKFLQFPSFLSTIFRSPSFPSPRISMNINLLRRRNVLWRAVLHLFPSCCSKLVHLRCARS